MSKRVYILDAGHGGINPNTGQYVTSGKRSPKWPDGSVYYEGVGNREIACLCGMKLKALGIDYVYTVTPTEWQDVSLSVRVARANAVFSKEPAVLISIHSNAAADPKAHGFEVFTSPGQTISDKYATILYQEFAKEFPELKGRAALQDGDPDKEELFTMVARPKCPAMLIETMFHTNPKECKMLMDPIVQDRIATAIVNAIIEMEKL
jgi:N-acetylmuramoyl-L-alanine amidase